MKRILAILLGFTIIFNLNLRADEGMWLLPLIGKNYEDMKKQGFRLSPEDIYSVNNSSIKDAIIGLGKEGSPFWHFCTGEIVSDQGLFFTNHHCGYGMIQSHSTVEHDYLKDGFWAYSQDQELANPGTTASILVRIEDVSEQILSKLNDGMSEKERQEIIDKEGEALSAKAVEGTPYKAYVTDMFNNNQFFLFVYVIYQDVRLVGAPPSSIGKFGGDTDNWMWPRHTGDFAMFRVYTGPDGNPAPYSEENIPLKPKHFLPVSNKGVKDGDFAMIIGFPGTTNRYITSFGLEETMNVTNKLRFEIRDVKVKVLRAEMRASQKTKIQYASKYASTSNYWKYSEQQNKALKHLNTMQIKKEIEAEYLKVNTDPKYKEALNLLEKDYKDRYDYAVARMYLLEGLISGPELPFFAYKCSGLLSALESKDEERINKLVEAIKQEAESFYKDYNPDTEKKVEIALFNYVYNNLDKTYHPDFFNTIEKKYKLNFDKYVNDMFNKSVFATKEKLFAFLENPNLKTLQKDLVLSTGISILSKYREVNTQYWKNSDDIDKGSRIFTEGILNMNKGKLMAPDANSSIRLTYGQVRKYDPRDGVTYDYYTTIEGVMQKEDPESTEFEVPARLKELYKAKDFGPYVNEKGELSVCFISNNDITGGNSGSPVINGDGHLIGLAFDGNSEAMSGDIDFEENLQRCINLDVRYALFIIDKYAGAKNLIKEMKIVN